MRSDKDLRMRTAIDTNILSLFWSGGSLAVTIDAQLSKLRAEGALVVSAPVFVELSAIPRAIRNASKSCSMR